MLHRRLRLVECVEEETPRFGSEDAVWTSSCKRPLEMLSQSVDNRSADAALRNTLGEKFRCAEKCDAKQLEKSFGEITEAGAFGRAPQRRRGSGLDSPFSGSRSRPTRPTSWAY